MANSTSQVQLTVLENGVRVVTDSMPHARSVAMCCLLGAGPQDEPDNKSGLAHLVEHLMFQGTSSRSAAQIADFMDSAGGRIGAFTARDYTCYFANVLDENAPFGIELLSDALLNSIFPIERLERERDAILNEINSGYDNPSTFTNTLMKKTAWPNHPLGRPIAGTVETVGLLDRDDAIYFVGEHYLPDRLIVAAAGNVNHEDFCALVRDGFWRMVEHSNVTALSSPTHTGGVVFKRIQSNQAYFSIGIPAYPYVHEKRYAVHVLNAILGGGMSSRLFKHIRKERGLVYDVGSDYEAYRDAGMLVIEGSTLPEYLLEVLDLVMAQLANLAEGNTIDDEELQRTKSLLRAQHLLAGEDSSTRMSRVATQQYYFGQAIDPDSIVAQIQSVDKEMLYAIAKELLHDAARRVTVAVAGPDASSHYDEKKILAVVEKYR